MCQALCQLAAHFALRQDNTVRTDALEHLGMHSASRFGNDVLRAQILEHDCDEDARLHIRTYRNDTAVEVAHADGPQHGFVLRVYGNFGIKVVQTWLGCILAATVIAFPLMYRNARAAFEQVDANLVYAARTLGMSEIKIFWKVVIPSAGPGILSGTILTFARAMGEYGATSMLAGNIPGKTGTISQKIAMVIQDGDYGTAGFWVVVIMLIAFFVVLVMNLLGSGDNKHKKRW